MILVQDLAARADGPKGGPPSFLRAASFTWERGVLAIVGTPHDGTTALLSALAGRSRATTGRVTVDGHAPAEIAKAIAWVPLDAALPDALRVDEACKLACRLRGAAPVPAEAQLAPLGSSALASRRVGSLSPAESRAVLLAIALASSARVLLVEEPLAGLEPAAPARVVEALRARAAAGTAVVVTTASVRDATRLADQLGVLTQGVFAHLPPALAHVGPGGARLRVIVSAGAPALVAALSAEAAVVSVETVAFAAAPTAPPRGAAAVVVSGPELLALARAVSSAVHRSGTSVDAIESQVMPLDAIRAALAAPRMGALPSRPPPAPMPPPASMPPASAPPASMPPSSPPAPPAPPPPSPPSPPPAEGGGA